MPRTKKGTGKKASSRPTTLEARPITTRSRSAETRAKSRTQEETSRTTRTTTTKRQSVSTNPPRAKRQRAVANTRRESDSEDTSEEVDDTPLTRADIPKIVDAVLSNFSTEDDSQAGDGSHLGEY